LVSRIIGWLVDEVSDFWHRLLHII